MENKFECDCVASFDINKTQTCPSNDWKASPPVTVEHLVTVEDLGDLLDPKTAAARTMIG